MSNPLEQQVGGDHYKSCAIQPVEYIHANKLDFFEGSVIKYVTRWRSKGGLKDLEKARHFIDLLIELEVRAKVAVNPTASKNSDGTVSFSESSHPRWEKGGPL